MKKIVYQKDFAFIYLTKDFYDKQKIEKAISNYTDFISYNIGQVGKYFVLKINLITSDYTLQTLANEILNFILSEQYQTNIKNNQN